ncbi:MULTISPECIES: MarR family transcriptional regulator [Bacillaceae]|uniref:MarR family winged helix-turn-helix transcriptional regulator n=1 Tax=Bacillaceae TaxID=186817 RepID=UPI001E333E63|nr:MULTISPECIES: MarR family transcriptional regulator [Bacillaceae]MCE4050522.1 MarR family transcriptional regulator [Bacillus sp. Au-Bac7]MCM3030543.1 MarR family transcriptional regulator [Niallia sp. MER 6]MDL0434533.1 MarR family transcriptional regulator [Niallia sp. SS-2023]UPO88497.1 MarR family transcriptional regulator [Niallia sp. Man26]
MKEALNNELIRSYARISKAYYQLLKEDADRMGLTAVQLKALYRVSFQPNISLGELADKLRLTKSTVSGVIDRLVQQDMIERTTQTTDRRAVNLHLTKLGNEKLEALMHSDSVVARKIKEIMQFPDEDIQKLLELNNKILTILNSKEDFQE